MFRRHKSHFRTSTVRRNQTSNKQLSIGLQRASAWCTVIFSVLSFYLACVVASNKQEIKDMGKLLSNQQSELNVLLQSNKNQLQQTDILIRLFKSSITQDTGINKLVMSSQASIKKMSDQLDVSSNALVIQNRNYGFEQQSEFFKLRDIYAKLVVPPYSGWYISNVDVSKLANEKNDSSSLNFFEKFRVGLESGFNNKFLLQDTSSYNVWLKLYQADTGVIKSLKKVMDPETKYYSTFPDTYQEYRGIYVGKYLSQFCPAYETFNRYFKERLRVY